LRFGAAAVGLLILLSACGGGSDTAIVTFQPDIPETTSDLNTAAILDATVGTIRRRAQLYGLEVPEITVGTNNSMTIAVKGIERETAIELFGARALLEFKQPVLTQEGVVSCLTAEGERFGVLPENVNPDDASRSPARCSSRDKSGDPEWELARPSAGGEGLTADSVQANGWSVREDALVATFTPQAAATLGALTGELTGYPLGIFIDGDLVAAPRISRTIDNGEAIISGFGAEMARLRAAQLNSPPLPVNLALVSDSPSAP
jgi:preprotein translocase subunit SecD